jgi:DNA-binding winged helix-turn-helix (wHTH) protein
MEQTHALTFDAFRLEPPPGGLCRGDTVIALRPRSLAVLRYLVMHAGRLVTKAELRQHVWGGTHVSDTVLRVCVQEIRAALGDTAEAPQYLETVAQQGYQFRVASDTEEPPPQTAGPIVGRQPVVERLEAWFQRAIHGARQLVFVSGDVGIGKTTVVDLFLAHLAAGSDVRIGRGQCVEHYGEGEPYLLFLEALWQLAHGPAQDTLLAVLRRYAPLWLVQLPGLVSEPELERLQRQVAGATPARMQRELAQALDVLATDAPLVLVLEDLQWSDRSTVDLLASLAQRREPAPLLVLGTYRPVDVVLQAHPLHTMVQELGGRGQVRELPLELLTAEDVAAYLTERLRGPIASPLAAVCARAHRWECPVHGEPRRISGAATAAGPARGAVDVTRRGRGPRGAAAGGGPAVADAPPQRSSGGGTARARRRQCRGPGVCRGRSGGWHSGSCRRG